LSQLGSAIAPVAFGLAAAPVPVFGSAAAFGSAARLVAFGSDAAPAAIFRFGGGVRGFRLGGLGFRRGGRAPFLVAFTASRHDNED